MAISLTSDPIIAAADVNTILGWSATGQMTYLAINSVSARFLEYTGRDRITAGAISGEIHRLPPHGCPVIWLRANPVNTGETFTVQIYNDGSLSETVASGSYVLYADTGRLSLPSHGVLKPDYTRDVRVSYTGGWAAASIPWDIRESAIQLMVLDKQRRDGGVGVQSISREGEATTYQTNDLPDSVRQVWDRYRKF